MAAIEADVYEDLIYEATEGEVSIDADLELNGYTDDFGDEYAEGFDIEALEEVEALFNAEEMDGHLEIFDEFDRGYVEERDVERLRQQLEEEIEGEISSSDYIKWVQRSFNNIYGINLRTDGKISGAYRAALRRFNKEWNGRDYDDIDSATQNDLIFANEGRPNYVAWIVAALNRAGWGPIPVSSTITISLKKAIKKFQKAMGLKTDGFVGSNTELALIKASGLMPPGVFRRAPKPVKPPKRPTPEPSVKPLKRAGIENFTWAVIGDRPSNKKWLRNLDVAIMVASFLNAAWKSVTSTSGPIGPGFFLEVYRRFDVEYQAKPYTVRGIAIGMSYALMDSVLGRSRSSSTLKHIPSVPSAFRDGFRAGYRKMRSRYLSVRKEPAIKALSKRLRAVRSKSTAVKIIYGALFRVFYLREKLHKYPVTNSQLRFCEFTYHSVKVCCGSNPGCNPHLSHSF